MNTLRDYLELYKYEPFKMDLSHKKNELPFYPLVLSIAYDKEDSLVLVHKDNIIDDKIHFDKTHIEILWKYNIEAVLDVQIHFPSFYENRQFHSEKEVINFIYHYFKNQLK